MENFSIQGGGLVATALVTVSRLGGRARFAGFLGTSRLATSARENLQRSHVDTSLILHLDKAEPIIAMVITEAEEGERTIFFTKRNCFYPSPEDYRDLEWMKNTRVFLFDSVSEKAGVAMARNARELGVTTVIDAERINDYSGAALESADHVIVPEAFARDYSGESDIKKMLSRLRSRPDQSIVITSGARGCSALWQDEMIHQPAFPVEAVDTTGAGDIFHGAYAFCVSRGKDPFYACRYASAAAALSTLGTGGQLPIPADEEVLELLQVTEA
jgi:sugar/nucleoside kinase (ribokinase family)